MSDSGFVSVIFVVVFRSMKRRKENTRLLQTQRREDVVTANFYFLCPCSSVPSFEWSAAKSNLSLFCPVLLCSALLGFSS